MNFKKIYHMKLSHKNTWVLMTMFFLTTTTIAQKSEVGNWYIYFGNQKINNKFNWWNEVQYRNYDFGGDLQQLLLRTGLGYNLSENNNNILLGYGFIYAERYDKEGKNKTGSDEHRIYQQFITKQSIGIVNLQHRYRIEERILEDDFSLRFRYFLSLNIPINHKTMTKRTLYASAYNEIFLNNQSSIFDRNRLYGALGYVVNTNLRFELGYMAQTLEKSNRNQFQIVFFNSLPFKQ